MFNRDANGARVHAAGVGAKQLKVRLVDVWMFLWVPRRRVLVRCGKFCKSFFGIGTLLVPERIGSCFLKRLGLPVDLC